MKKKYPAKESITRNGYNEKNPGQPHGAFPPDADGQRPKQAVKSTKADKKFKEDAS